MPSPDIGRAAQSAIYRAGTYGRRPRVPTDGRALEEAARRAMSRRAFSRVLRQSVVVDPALSRLVTLPLESNADG